jgi:hypothetical protein
MSSGDSPATMQTVLNSGTFVNIVCYDKYDTDLMSWIMNYYLGILRKDVGT